MKKIAIITALVASVATPAFAQSALQTAVQVHNGSADNALERIQTPASDLTMGVTASSRSAQVIARTNASSSMAGDRFDPSRATVFSGETPDALAGLLRQLDEESRGMN